MGNELIPNVLGTFTSFDWIKATPWWTAICEFHWPFLFEPNDRMCPHVIHALLQKLLEETCPGWSQASRMLQTKVENELCFPFSMLDNRSCVQPSLVAVLVCRVAFRSGKGENKAMCDHTSDGQCFLIWRRLLSLWRIPLNGLSKLKKV